MKVPKGWELANIGRVAQVNGQSHEAFSGDTVAFLAMTDVSESGKVLQFQFRNQADVASGFTKFAESDVLVAKITPCFENGKGAHIKKLPTTIGYGSTEFHVLRAGPEIIDDFLYLITRTAEFRRRGESNMVGSAGQKRVQADFVRGYRFPLPPLGEQRRIAEILGAWDEAIEKVQALIQAKHKLKRALMHQLLTPTRRFPQFNGQWRQVHLGDVFVERVERGRTDLKLLAVTGSDGVVDREDLVRRDTSAEDKSLYLRVCPGDIAYNTMRMWQGVFGLSKMNGIVSPAYTIVTPTDELDGTFAAYLFKLPKMIHQFWRYSQGLVSDTLNLKFPNFAQVKIEIPEKAEQVVIAGTLAAIDAEIQVLERQYTTLTTQKRGLMQKLLTGQVRVNAAD